MSIENVMHNKVYNKNILIYITAESNLYDFCDIIGLIVPHRKDLGNFVTLELPH